MNAKLCPKCGGDKIPVSISSATFKICGIRIVAHICDDGSRFIETEGFHMLLEAMGGELKPHPDWGKLNNWWLKGEQS